MLLTYLAFCPIKVEILFRLTEALVLEANSAYPGLLIRFSLDGGETWADYREGLPHATWGNCHSDYNASTFLASSQFPKSRQDVLL